MNLDLHKISLEVPSMSEKEIKNLKINLIMHHSRKDTARFLDEINLYMDIRFKRYEKSMNESELLQKSFKIIGDGDIFAGITFLIEEEIKKLGKSVYDLY